MKRGRESTFNCLVFESLVWMEKDAIRAVIREEGREKSGFMKR